MNWAKKIVVAGRLPEEYERRIRAEFPGVTLVICGGDAERIREEIVDAHMVFGRVTRDQFLLGRALELVHVSVAGVESMCFPEMVASQVVMTNSRGIHSRPMAEHIQAMMLALYRNLPAMLKAQYETRWAPLPREQFSTLEGKTVGLLGTGTIGDLTAKLCQAFGCRTIGFNLSGHRTIHIESVYSGRALSEFLALSDVVVNTLPHTPATRGLMGAEQFSRMKRSAIFINVGRGATVAEPALVNALQEGSIAGAGLDVFAQEPLAPDSPLWRMPNVIISPHQSGDVPSTAARVYDLFIENLRRYRDGQPLLNVVDKAKGY
ncbi:MAG: D-2-hydroxyacid dehydrogenase [Candidatus Hydrogenedentes bacterium]|nr:D-2-hydroxyacid dehydrogenase [Candidatus Hydrogenedentota bacterium]